MAMLVVMFMSHGLSVSIVKCTVLSCESACVNQCSALPNASAAHTVTCFLSPQILSGRGCTQAAAPTLSPSSGSREHITDQEDSTNTP